MVAPYLDVPLMGSEEEDMQQQAADWAARQAAKAYLLADDLCRGLDKHAEAWRPDVVAYLDQLVEVLSEQRRRMIAENILGKGDCHDAD